MHFFGVVFVVLAAQPADIQTSGNLVIGDAPFEVHTVGAGQTQTHTGNVFVVGSGTLLVEGGVFRLQGVDTNILVSGQGKVIFRNGARLEYAQTYIAQHNLIVIGDGSAEFRDSTVDPGGSIQNVWLRENASYTAVSTQLLNWTTWYIRNQPSLTLENVPRCGDIVFYDSPMLRFVNSAIIMPWLHFPAGSSADLAFPTAATPVSMDISSATPGVSGIGWSLSVVNCSAVLWGVTPYPGSTVTVRDSQLRMARVPYAGSGDFVAAGTFRNESSHVDDLLPIPDRTFRLINTSVRWWKVDVENTARLQADSLRFSEMMVRDSAEARVTHSICEGQTIHLGATNGAFVHFQSGEVWTYVSVWDNAVMILDESLVDPSKGAITYQTRNIAHGNSRLYCINSTLVYPPEAADGALVAFGMIDEPAGPVGNTAVPVTGSAWIEVGPNSTQSFSGYELAFATEGSSTWTTIAQSNQPVREDVLGTWDTTTLTAGSYQIKLTLLASGDASPHPVADYPAIRTFQVSPPPAGDDDGGRCGSIGLDLMLPLALLWLARRRKRSAVRRFPKLDAGMGFSSG
ncbi:MAG: hypothetical protein HYY16_10300 [Planctomycetes bacterium]|nr:hypothetical protein [Planctomycetota bacterium]